MAYTGRGLGVQPPPPEIFGWIVTRRSNNLCVLSKIQERDTKKNLNVTCLCFSCVKDISEHVHRGLLSGFQSRS